MLCRNKTVDVAKGLGIIFVVLGHNWIVYHQKGELFRVLYSFHVPLFFFISGLYIKSSDRFFGFFQSKADALLKPFVVVVLFVGLGKLISSDAIGIDYISGALFATGETISWVPLWFLPHLFISVLFVWFVLGATRLCRHKNILFGVLCIVFLIFGVKYINVFWHVDVSDSNIIRSMIGDLSKSLPGLPLSLDLVLVSSAFVLLGYSFEFKPIGFFVASAIFFCLHLFFDETIDLNARLYGDFFVSSLQAVSGIYLVFAISELLTSYRILSRLLSYVGSCSLFILIFHNTLQGKAFSFISRVYEAGYFAGMVSLLASVVVSVIGFEIVRRQSFLSVIFLPRKRVSKTEVVA